MADREARALTDSERKRIAQALVELAGNRFKGLSADAIEGLAEIVAHVDLCAKINACKLNARVTALENRPTIKYLGP